jgi:hypothetical protein
MIEPSGKKDLLTTNRKALTVNLDGTYYGTLAEIGAGQEVARLFFQAGGASGSIAKTMSAYDMMFSDAIYGKAPRYVSRERLLTMLDHEYRLLEERLASQRGGRTRFFVFANTVVTRSFKGDHDGHGWLGIRYQLKPGEAPSDILLHVRMWDKETVAQQQALGIVGANLIYGAFYLRDDPRCFIGSLVDNVGTERVEIDMLKFSGPAFRRVDNRILSLHLVYLGLTNAVMFGPDGDVLQPSEVLHKKAVLIERGGFHPVTRAHLDRLACARQRFLAEPTVQGKDTAVLMEITMDSLLAGGELDAADFLSRVDMLGCVGCTTLISNYWEYHRLVAYVRRYSTAMIGIAMAVDNLLEVFDAKQSASLPGGVLEAVGRMFRHAVKLYVYPKPADAGGAGAPGQLVTACNAPIPPALRHLHAHLRENGYFEALDGFDPTVLAIAPRDVRRRIVAGDATWETMVPPPVAEIIRQRGLFGWKSTG